MRSFAALIICLLLSGCIVLQPRAENPYPNMNTVAVVPFFNQSAVPGEINDLGRTFGLAYSTELQKIPGYDVVAFGVVDTTITEYNKYALKRQLPLLDMRNSADVLRLAEMLGVDAIVVGAITEYDPYYPPKIGMKVNWYTTKNWTITADEEPCGPCEDAWEDENGECSCDYELPELRTKVGNSVIRGQNAVPLFEYEAEPLLGFDSSPLRITSLGSTTANRPLSAEPPAEPGAEGAVAAPRSYHPPVSVAGMSEPLAEAPVQLLHPVTPIPLGEDPVQSGRIVRETPQSINLANQAPLQMIPASPAVVQAESQTSAGRQPAPRLYQPPGPKMPQPEFSGPPTLRPVPALQPIPMDPALLERPGTVIELERDHSKPVMSYTKIFDGKDDEIVRLLRDYVEIQGDRRSGGWEGYMQRTNDYIGFCCHVMIVDMLSLHGGALKTKVWLKHRKNP